MCIQKLFILELNKTSSKQENTNMTPLLLVVTKHVILVKQALVI